MYDDDDNISMSSNDVSMVAEQPQVKPSSTNKKPRPIKWKLKTPQSFMPPPPAPSTPVLRHCHSSNNLNVQYNDEDLPNPHTPSLHRRHTLSGAIQSSEPPSTEPKPASKRKSPRDNKDKLEAIMDELKACRWTIGQFLLEYFRPTDEEGRPVTRDIRGHNTAVTQFLNGQSTPGIRDIVRCWVDDPLGRAAGSDEEEQLYSTEVPYHTLRHAEAVFTSLAAQLVKTKLAREMRVATDSKNGLHGTGVSKKGRKEMRWDDIGPHTVDDVMKIIKRHQPLTFTIIKDLVTPEPWRRRDGVRVVRKTRPPELVSAELIQPNHNGSDFRVYKTSVEIISTMDFLHTQAARRLPAARSVLYFACGAQQSLFKYGSRTGQLLSWSTTVRQLQRLGENTAEKIRELGQSGVKAGIVRFDNVQRWLKQREMRMGREEHMKIGVAATVAEMIDFDAEALELDYKLASIAENKRKDLTADSFMMLIDHKYMELIGELQWLETLVNTVPQLRKYKPDLAKIRRSEGAKLRIPVHRTVVHPLKPVAKNEAITTELRDTLYDFLKQLGLEPDKPFKRRIVFIGGDGMSFEKTILIKYYLQFQDGELRSLIIVQPFLELWHTVWTNLSMIFECHWGEPLTKDPSRLGHSAAKIGQKTPSNLNKVDYYPASYLAYLVLDARMLDCWRLHFSADNLFAHFDDLEKLDNLPDLADLRKAARTLHKRYSTQRAYEMAMHGMNPPNFFPVGSPWVAPEVDETSHLTQKAKTKAKKAAAESDDAFSGDQTLAQSIMFMHVTLILRDVVEAIADGDIGRVYEGLKYMLFEFAGSNHHPKYATYLLEQITQLEFESSPRLRALFLKNWLVNTKGQAGHFKPGDLMEEGLNLILEEMLSRNDANWDDPRVRDVIAPNVQYMADLKNHWGEGLGLAPRRSRHPEPHSRPELRTLLQLYKQEELHMFQSGRSYDRSADDVDIVTKGAEKLRKGKLKKWIDITMRARDLASTMGTTTQSTNDNENEIEFSLDGDDNDEDEDEFEAGPQTGGGITLVNGELVIETVEAEADEVEDSDRAAEEIEEDVAMEVYG
ncbi:hypothetical protein NM688_g3779 [Phlebia brevispora]|uniref:Uncharacterized protein n=1 Tax=Phlebia brevispora TaxID=194682 RepID=A0ACC1T4S3_9APHY|nr:hypothetical protein NM688_g3779 [Phlebia brevispora]